MQLQIGDRSFVGPVLIPSISSFETQVTGSTALRLQSILQEPISLISAYDLGRDNDLNDAILDYRANGGSIFIDSGGYESSRINKYLDPETLEYRKENGHAWSIKRYQENIESIEFDLAASFDTFIGNDEEFSAFEGRLIAFIEDQEKFLGDRMVPVIHLQSIDGTRKLPSDQILSVVCSIANSFRPKFIAIPEREMGEGIVARYELVKSLVSELEATDCGTKIHVLGCGNPLTFAILAHAGIALADGLEWCRTNYGHNFHLYHFQQFDIVCSANLITPNAVSNTFKDYTKNKLASALAQNLHSQQDFVERLKSALTENEMLNFISEYFEVQPEIKELLS